MMADVSDRDVAWHSVYRTVDTACDSLGQFKWLYDGNVCLPYGLRDSMWEGSMVRAASEWLRTGPRNGTEQTDMEEPDGKAARHGYRQ